MMSAPHAIALTCASETARERLALLNFCMKDKWGTRTDLTDGGAPLFRALCTPRSATITTLNLVGRNFTSHHTPLLRRALEHMPALLKLDLSCVIGMHPFVI